MLDFLAIMKLKYVVGIKIELGIEYGGSFGSAIILLHFSHFEVSNGSYIGIITLTSDSGEGCSMKSLFTEPHSHDHNENISF